MAPSRSAIAMMSGAALAAELGRVVADVAEALHDDPLALEARVTAPAASSRPACAQASRSAKNRPRPVASRRPRTPPCVTGLPVTHPIASSCPGLSAA